MKLLANRWLGCTALSAVLAAGVLAPARADEQTVKLIKLLIQKGILSPGQANDLLKETAPAPRGHAHAAPAAPLESEEAAPAANPGQIRVTYVPQFIRKQIADQVRAQVMDEAKEEGWAAPNALPDWTQRITMMGSMRFRYRADIFDKNNSDQFINFNDINNGSAFDANNYGVGSATQTNPPFLNTTEDRNRFQVRATLGAQAVIDDWVTTTVIVGTGQDDGPVTPNQTLGNVNGANGASGDFAKPSIWLDKGYFTLTPLPQLTVLAGREPNPFLPSDLMFYRLLGFDGVAAQYSQNFGNFHVFGTAGGFPLFNTAFDFSTDSEVKYASRDSYLAALQAGAEWQFAPHLKATLGVGIFDYLGVQGAISSPCAVELGGAFNCDTDNTRAAYEQFGNSLYPIRNIIPYQPSGVTPAPNPPDPQYYGLASRFNVLNIHPIFDITTYDPFDIRLEGEFIKNLAFDRSAIIDHGAPREVPGPVNNLGSDGEFLGGDTGYMAKVTLGQMEIRKVWDWSAFFSYRYLQSDATLDAIADADFHEGGTNAQGYILGGDLGVARNTWVELRLMNAQAVSGPHYGTEQIFLDLNSNF
jgi:hypothetical protein